MLNLYDKNGLIFWTENEIKIRDMLKDYFTDFISRKPHALACGMN